MQSENTRFKCSFWFITYSVYPGLGLLFSERHKCDELTSFWYCALELHCNYILQFCTASTGMKNVTVGQSYSKLLLCHILTGLIQKNQTMYFDYCTKVFHSLSELKYTGEKSVRLSLNFSWKIPEIQCSNPVTLILCLI